MSKDEKKYSYVVELRAAIELVLSATGGNELRYGLALRSDELEARESARQVVLSTFGKYGDDAVAALRAALAALLTRTVGFSQRCGLAVPEREQIARDRASAVLARAN